MVSGTLGRSGDDFSARPLFGLAGDRIDIEFADFLQSFDGKTFNTYCKISVGLKLKYRPSALFF